MGVRGRQDVGVRTRKPLPPRLGDHFTVREAAAAKVSRRRLGADDLARPFHGIRSREEPCSFRDSVDCYRRRMRRGQRYTGRTALRIWGLPAPWAWHIGEPLEVAVDVRDNPPRTRGVRGRRMAADAAVTWKVGGLAAVDPIAAVFSVAPELRIEQAVVLRRHSAGRQSAPRPRLPRSARRDRVRGRWAPHRQGAVASGHRSAASARGAWMGRHPPHAMGPRSSGRPHRPAPLAAERPGIALRSRKGAITDVGTCSFDFSEDRVEL